MRKLYSYGPNIVHEPTDTSSIVADICFVHGLGGHREDTWTKKEGKGSCFWPKELLSTDIGNVRIISWGYNAAIVAFFGTDSKESLQGLGNALINDLSILRKREVRERPLIFVAHSLGGLVVKQAIIQSNTHYNNKSSRLGDMFPAVKCAMFLATPHRGSNAANWADMITTITAPLAIRLSNKELMKTLKSDSCALYNQRETFLAVRHSVDLDVPCFYENRPTSKMTIVPKDFAVIEDCHTRIAMDADHHEICKFNDKNDVNYQRVLNEIQMAVEKIETERDRAAKEVQERLKREAREVQESTARVSRQGQSMRSKVALTLHMKQYLMGLGEFRKNWYRKEGDPPNIRRPCKIMDESLGRGIDHASPAYILAYFVICRSLDLPEYIDDFKLPPAKGRLSSTLEFLSQKNKEKDELLKSDCMKHWELEQTKKKRKGAEIQLRRLVALLHRRRVGQVADIQENELDELRNYITKGLKMHTRNPTTAAALWRKKKEE